MEDWAWPKRLVYGAKQCVGLGFVVGAMESVGLATSLKLPLSTIDFALLGACALAVMGAASVMMGVVAGLIVHPASRGQLTSRAVSWQLAVATILLCGFYLWQGAASLFVRDQAMGAVAMALMPLGFSGVIFYNARFWLRRTEVGKGPRFGWWQIALGGSATLVLGAALIYPSRDTGGDYALEGDANVVLITVDGLRRDHVGVFGGTGTPSLDALASEGIAYHDAVTPSPSSAASSASVLTGLHPLRHKVLFDGDSLALGHRTIAEVLAAEGYATGGFVSTRATRDLSGLSQGFRVFDDDFTPFLPAVPRINLLSHALSAWLVLLDQPELAVLAQRDGDETVARFLKWFDRHADVPFFAWIHIADPAMAVGGGPAAYADAVRGVDAGVGRIRAALEERDVLDDTLVIAVGGYGVHLGEHGLQGSDSIYDEAVRVPLVIRAPGIRVDVPKVDPQVRVIDVAATVLDYLRLDPLGHSEGVSLLGYGQGLRRATIWCSLVARDGDDRVLFGLRNNGVKYIRGPLGEALYDLGDDPAEADNLIAEQDALAEQARQLLSGEAAALESLLAER